MKRALWIVFVLAWAGVLAQEGTTEDGATTGDEVTSIDVPLTSNQSPSVNEEMTTETPSETPADGNEPTEITSETPSDGNEPTETTSETPAADGNEPTEIPSEIPADGSEPTETPSETPADETEPTETSTDEPITESTPAPTTIPTTTVFVPRDYNYSKVLELSLLFYEAQRSGKLPANNRITWRRDSALNDSGVNGEDLTGGYYDGSGYLKSSFLLASATTVLSWGLIDYRDVYDKSGQLVQMREAIKWATDYLMKAHVAPDVLYGQVGKFSVDKGYWGRPEDMDVERPAYMINSTNPGADLAAEVAAALSSASIALKRWNFTYSWYLLDHATKLYDFATNYQGLYQQSITDAVNTYPSKAFVDELVWGGAWMYRASNDPTYLYIAERIYESYGMGARAPIFSWQYKNAGAQVLLAELTGNDQYKTSITKYCDYMINTATKTPKQLLYDNPDAPLRYAANTAFICLQAAKLQMNGSEVYREFSRRQIGYILGDGGRSYVIGFGDNPPVRPYHEASSCPSPPEECNRLNEFSADANPHVLQGAVVAGPDINDNYRDVRTETKQSKVSIDYNAGFQSAVAALQNLKMKGLLMG